METSLSGCGDYCSLCMILKIYMHETKTTHHLPNIPYALFLDVVYLKTVFTWFSASEILIRCTYQKIC